MPTAKKNPVKKKPKQNPNRTSKFARIIPDEANWNKREAFRKLIEGGTEWGSAIMKVGISPVEAAQVIDDILIHRRDGVAIYMCAEKYLMSAMKTLDDLSSHCGDDRIKLMAAAKLGDTAFRILCARPFIDNAMKSLPASNLPKQDANTWDAEFEG